MKSDVSECQVFHLLHVKCFILKVVYAYMKRVNIIDELKRISIKHEIKFR